MVSTVLGKPVCVYELLIHIHSSFFLDLDDRERRAFAEHFIPYLEYCAVTEVQILIRILSSKLNLVLFPVNNSEYRKNSIIFFLISENGTLTHSTAQAKILRIIFNSNLDFSPF